MTSNKKTALSYYVLTTALLAIAAWGAWMLAGGSNSLFSWMMVFVCPGAALSSILVGTHYDLLPVEDHSPAE